MKANCLFCYSLNVKQARPQSGYWKASFGKCHKKDFHIVKNIRNCTLYFQVGSHYQNYFDSLEKYANHILEIVKNMNEQSPEWYTHSDNNKGVKQIE